MTRVGGTIFALLLAMLLSHNGWLQPLESRLMDAQFRLLRAYALKPAPDNVVVVGFNEDTTRVLREPLSLWHPHIARFVQAAAAAGATVIGLDVVLPDRSFDDIVPGNDRKLLAAVLTARRSTPVVLALTVDPAGHTRPIHPPFVAAAGSDATGYALLPVDPDGTVRRFDERIQLDGSSVPTLAGQMARRLGRSVDAGVIDFAAGAQFDFLPLETVLAWLDAGDSAKLEQAFKGRAVLLGSVLKYEDRLDAPVNLLAWDAHASNVPGVLLHAQVLRNLLGDGLVRNVAGWVPLLLSLAAALLWLWAPRPLRALAILAVVCLAGLALSTVALARGHAVPVATPLFVALLATGARQMLATAFELRERRRLRRAFGGYVSPAVMQEILAGTLNPAPGGVRQYACVLFSDIRGFTTLSEHLGAEQTIAFLNRYFERIVPIIHTHGGTVVSFMGDGIMAVFGAPKPLPNPCAAAYATALAMLELRRQLASEGVAQGQAALEIGIGLHAGEGVAGHIGAAARHEYTVIGDVTNVAARLEGVTKEVGYRLVCSRVVAEQLADHPELVPLGAHAIKGHSPVEIFGIEPSAPANVAP